MSARIVLPKMRGSDSSSASRASASMAGRGDDARIPLLPAAIEATLRRQAIELWGGGLVLGGVALALALFSYTPHDPSWDTSLAGTPGVFNWLGPWGARVADILRQGFGWASLSLSLLLFAWGARFLRAGRLGHCVARSLAAIVAVALLAGGCAGVFSAGAPGRAGGAFGAIVFGLCARGTAAMRLHAGPVAQGMALCLAGLLALRLSSATPVASFGRAIADFGRSIYEIWTWLRGLYEFFAGGREARTARTPNLPVQYEAREQAPPSPVDAFNAVPAATSAAKQPAAKQSAPKKQAAKPATAERAFGGEIDALPPIDLLQAPVPPKGREAQHNPDTLRDNGIRLEGILGDFGVQGAIVGVQPGPVVTRYELEPSPGTRAARVIGLSDDIARSMSAASVRAAVIPGRNAIGIELPNAKRELVYLRTLLEAPTYRDTASSLPLVLGRDIAGEPVIADLARMPHLLVAGTTGSGKSVAINTMILSLLYRLPPSKCRLILVDPKMLELSVYEGIPHLLAPVVTEPKKAVVALKWVVREMEERYRAMSRFGVRNIDGYNVRLSEARKQGEILSRKVQTGFDAETGKPVFEEQAIDMTELPYIVVVVDEMADLMLVAGKEIEICIQRLAQMARAAGIHLIMATQRPSVDVITGTIKANFPTRISFQVTSKIDSRTILGEQGAEQLLGQGDMLYMAGGGRILRVHGPFVRDSEVEAVARFLRESGEPAYVDAITVDIDEDGDGTGGDEDSGVGGNTTASDALYDRAVDLVLREGKASTSFLQRHLQLGYNRAARLIDRMEEDGLISPANHVGKREIFGRRA